MGIGSVVSVTYQYSAGGLAENSLGSHRSCKLCHVMCVKKHMIRI